MPSEARDECSECGKQNTPIHRRYKTQKYCQSCYQRVFKPQECPSCKKIARLPFNIANAICDNCERLKPCIRCGRQGDGSIRLSKFGAVCNSCSLYFTQPKKCSVCNSECRRYSRSTHSEADVVVCVRCAQKGDFGTCGNCRRYRKLSQCEGSKGPICFKCSSLGSVPCKRCKCLHPAGFGDICENCYRKDLLERRLTITSNMFSTKMFRGLFTQFSEWLATHCGVQVASIQLNKYAPILQKIEFHWGYIPNYEDLVSFFSVAYLRRFKRLVDWLIEQKQIEADAKIKAQDSEIRMIQKQLQQSKLCDGTESICRKYLATLMSQVSSDNLKLRTARLYMCAAIGFAKVTEKTPGQKFNQRGLIKYLKSAPGQKASITRFVNYLNLEQNTELWLPALKKTDAVRARFERKLEEKMFTLLSRETAPLTTLSEEWAILSLQLFHKLPIKTCKHLIQKSACVESENGYELIFDNQAFWVPSMKFAIEKIIKQIQYVSKG